MGKIALLIILGYTFIAFCAFVNSKRNRRIRKIIKTGACDLKCKKCPLNKKCKLGFTSNRRVEFAKEYLELL